MRDWISGQVSVNLVTMCTNSSQLNSAIKRGGRHRCCHRRNSVSGFCFIGDFRERVLGLRTWCGRESEISSYFSSLSFRILISTIEFGWIILLFHWLSCDITKGKFCFYCIKAHLTTSRFLCTCCAYIYFVILWFICKDFILLFCIEYLIFIVLFEIYLAVTFLIISCKRFHMEPKSKKWFLILFPT